MDYAELFERQGRVMDDLLLHAFRIPQDRFVAPGPEGAPSLRDLVTEWLEAQRRTVHGTIQGHPYQPLPAAVTSNVLTLAQAFGGFRMTLRDAVEAVAKEDLTRKLAWQGAGGAGREVTLDEVLAHLVLHGARMTGLVAARLRQMGESPPPTDLLA